MTFSTILILLVLSIASNMLYLTIVIFSKSLDHPYFLFLNSFMIVNFVNLTVEGLEISSHKVKHCLK